MLFVNAIYQLHFLRPPLVIMLFHVLFFQVFYAFLGFKVSGKLLMLAVISCKSGPSLQTPNHLDDS